MQAVSSNNMMLIGLGVFLSAAVIEDFTRRRISNVLTVGATLLALVLHFVANGSEGLLHGLGGFAVGLGVFLPFFLMGGMGAGDVKTMAAAGAFLAPLPSLLAAGLSLIAGAMLGLVVLAWRGGFLATIKSYGQSLLFLSSTRRWLRPSLPAVAAQRFPYALAIALGTLGAVAWLGTR
jgi:prepilin peptidase CpaA